MAHWLGSQDQLRSEARPGAADTDPDADTDADDDNGIGNIELDHQNLLKRILVILISLNLDIAI
jgi:hypothetical protein